MHLIDPDRANIATATAAGSLVSLVVTRKYAPAYILTLFMVGQATAFYFTIPLAQYLNLSLLSWPPLGFAIGALGMFTWGAIIALLSRVWDDPLGTVVRAWRLWKGGKE